MIVSLLLVSTITMSHFALSPTISVISSLKRCFPNSQFAPSATCALDAARGERVSCQIVVRTAEAPETVKIVAPKMVKTDLLVRRVGYVTQKHLNTGTSATDLDGVGNVPGLVPDPLLPETEVTAGPFEAHSFWLTITPHRDAVVGPVDIPVSVKIGENESQITIHLNVHKAVLPERKNFPVTHWFYCDALSDFYHLKPFEEKFWPILEKYMVDLVQHGNNIMHTPLFTPPTDGVKKPNQLLKVTREGKHYRFDWSDVHRFIQLTKKSGFTGYEWSHFFSQWGCQHAIRIYEGDPAADKLLWPPDTDATSPIYRDFLSQLIPELEKFLDQEQIRSISYFHISDEPHGDVALANYRKARAMMRELAPWMKFMDALSQISFANEGLIDMPIPSIETAVDFQKAGYPAWCYFCCGPRGDYLNRLMDTPLAKIRMSGWLFYRLKSLGFLHWGYNYWYQSQTRNMIDPFTEQSGGAWPGWAYGDTFMVYPGADGPIDSLRWEVFAESLQDFALLQASGLSPDDSSLKDIVSYREFPKTEEWVTQQHNAVLKALDDRTN